MEENIKNQKKMIREVLKESKTPLMAKRIAQLIYRKFDGYRMSRFVVRDILWKYMKEEIDYDKLNYTYSLFTNNSCSKKGFKEETRNYFDSGIEKQFYQFKTLLKSNDINPLFYGFIYNLPTPQEIIDNLDEIENDVLKQNFIPNQIIGILKSKINEVRLNDVDKDNLELLYLVLKRSLELKGKLNRNYQYKRFTENLSYPFHYFMVLLDLKQATQDYYEFHNPDFQKMFDEASRDNKISAAEEKYLYEKAKELGIDKNDLAFAIDNVDFKAFKSFKILVDEICEDGVITDSENAYIKEKAKAYNVSPSQLSRMIRSGLNKVELIKRYRSEVGFYNYVKSIFLMKLFDLDFDADFLTIDRHQDEDFLNKIFEDLRANIKEISTFLEYYLGFSFEFEEVDELLMNLGVRVKGLDDVININGPTKRRFSTNQESMLNINGYRYKIRWFENTKGPLFYDEYVNSIYTINLNKEHWFFESKSTSERKIIEKIILALVCTKSDFYGRELELFFNKLQGNIDLLKFEYQ